MDRDIKKATKEFLKVLITGGLYFMVIFVKVLFTTPAGQKIVERELDNRLKARMIEKEEETETPTAKIGFKVE